MSKKEKIKEQFIKDPTSLSLAKILNLLISEDYELVKGKGNHYKLIYIYIYICKMVSCSYTNS